MRNSHMEKQIREHYAHHLVIDTDRTPISKSTFSMLSEEVRSSGYASFLPSSYLPSCNIQETYRVPGCTIHVVCPEKDAPPKILMLRVVRRIHCLIRIFRISKPLTFWLLPTPHLRMFPKDTHTQLSPEHINGGFTYSVSNTIFVFRREEFPKVLLHETLHHASIDTHDTWTTTDLQKIYAYFNVDTKGCDARMQCESTDVRPNEAWVETWAELYHLAFLCHEYRLPWSSLLHAEQRWACVQAKRVLQHQRSQPDGKWREHTHAFSYMVLRAALLWCASAVIERPPSKDLAGFIVSCFENRAFQKCLQDTRVPPHMCFRMTVFGDM